jgi:dipeptidyl aminopeptidase/acylaminoacyl peptidase
MPSSSNTPRVSATLDLLMEMRIPTDLDITSDGKRVAFAVAESVPGEQKRRSRIWVADTTQGEARPFLSGKRDEICPRWSPDGKFLAFITAPEGEKEKPQLHLVAAEGGTPRLVCKMPNGVSELAWSPDGSRISFLSLEGEEPKGEPKILSPARHQRLWTVRPDQALPEAITSPNQTIREYTWSHDSTQLAVYYSAGPEHNDWYHSHIGTVSATGGVVREVVHLDLPASGLAWSPDGRQIAYISGSWSDPGRGSGDIFAVTLENGQVRNLTPNIRCSPSWCCWLPDSRKLLFVAVKGVTHEISLLDTVSGETSVLETDVVMQRDQPWLAITADRQRFATISATAQQPFDIWSGEFTSADNRPAGIAWKRISRLSSLVEETLETAPTERLSYESSDGQRVDALFTPPLHLEAGKLPPLYVEVHGGPSGAYCDTWYFDTHVFTAQGFAVFRPNYRGSWGQGAAFADAVLGDMGGQDLQDILRGVDYLVQQGRVDGNRVCIGGWSNGGYLSAWAVTQTDRFRAAMVGAGISDWLNMHAQTDIPDADILLLKADPLEDNNAYLRCSPLTFAGRVTTPTLILHGEDDPAVPVAQAYAFHRALRERNVPVECAIYPREGHGVGERDHVYDTFERQVRWFKQYSE